MMIYVIPKDDDKPIKIVFEGGKGSNPIVEDDQVYFIDEHPSPEEVGKAFRTLYERLMSVEEEVFEKQIPKKPINEGAITYVLVTEATWVFRMMIFLSMNFRCLNIAVIADVCLTGRRYKNESLFS